MYNIGQMLERPEVVAGNGDKLEKLLNLYDGTRPESFTYFAVHDAVQLIGTELQLRACSWYNLRAQFELRVKRVAVGAMVESRSKQVPGYQKDHLASIANIYKTLLSITDPRRPDIGYMLYALRTFERNFTARAYMLVQQENELQLTD